MLPEITPQLIKKVPVPHYYTTVETMEMNIPQMKPTTTNPTPVEQSVDNAWMIQHGIPDDIRGYKDVDTWFTESKKVAPVNNANYDAAQKAIGVKHFIKLGNYKPGNECMEQ